MPRPSQKDAIVEHGTEVMMTHGFQGAGVAEITAAAGVPKGSFYNHFPSKEAFAAEVLDRYFAGFAPLFEETLGNAALPGLDRVCAMADGLVEAVSAHEFRGCLLGTFAADASASSEALREAVSRRFRRWRTLLASAIEAGQSDGSVTAVLPAQTLAGFVISAFEGAALRAKADAGPEALHEFRRAVAALLVA